MIVKIGDKRYKVPTSHKELSLERYTQLYKVIQKSADKITDDNAFLITIELLEVLGIPAEVSVNVHPEDMPQVLSYITGLLTPPKEETKVHEHIRVNGTNYVLNTKSVDFMGNFKAFTDMTFAEFEDATAISQGMKDHMEQMDILMGIFYRPVQIWQIPLGMQPKYKSTLVPKIAEDMKSVTMDKVFGFYFFLLNRMSNFSNVIKDFLVEEERRQQLKMVGI